MTVYAVFARDEMTNQAEFDTYSEMVPDANVGHPLKPLAVYGQHVTLEGPSIEGAVILEFPTMEAATAWYNSPAYQTAVKHRHAAAKYRAFLVEGL
ncbi:DUF1330 domain-containing protein [Mesorhizobium sp. B2-3-5]|uniref:DUF1330 domain-containing protein n=1 Tax=Mesorhizobium sp. B2-3-5 TaxID=2589958 RepID=UPI00112A6F20|nr:DUF1330 domain-containing protein [Mesorhizobium sp. B2-3-5]TPM24594.1 DUF1330 domain-containing protein [Mesorhizobium sp. B2-3-5]